MAKILIIDDDPMVGATVRSVFVQRNHEVVCVTSGQQAIDQLKKETFDLAICDLIMPEMEGMETITNLRRIKPNLSVIAMSGGGRTRNFDFLKMADQIGAVDSISKPFSGVELMAVVNKHLCNASRETDRG